jgi:hypothetical protein
VLGPEEVGVDAPIGVVVIQEENEISQAHEQVSAIAGSRQIRCGAVDIADDLDPHRARLPQDAAIDLPEPACRRRVIA